MKSTLKNGLLLIVLHPLSGKIKIQNLISEFINGDKNIIGVGFESSHVRFKISCVACLVINHGIRINQEPKGTAQGNKY